MSDMDDRLLGLIDGVVDVDEQRLLEHLEGNCRPITYSYPGDSAYGPRGTWRLGRPAYGRGRPLGRIWGESSPLPFELPSAVAGNTQDRVSLPPRRAGAPEITERKESIERLRQRMGTASAVPIRDVSC